MEQALTLDEIKNLELLKEMEDLRQKLARREIEPGSPDWVVRYCQAIVAGQTRFLDRASWVEQLREIGDSIEPFDITIEL